MKLRVLCLDDHLESLQPILQRAFALLGGNPVKVPVLEGGCAPTFSVSGGDRDPLTVEICSNSDNRLDKVIEQIEQLGENGFDLVLVDDDWGTGGSYAGQERLISVVKRSVVGASPYLPAVVLFTQHWGDSTRAKRFVEIHQSTASDRRRVTGLWKEDASGLYLLLRRVVGEKRSLDNASGLAGRATGRHRSTLLSHFNGLVGMDAQLTELGDGMEIFFRWLRGEYDRALPRLARGAAGRRRDFPHCFLLRGEPGNGKTTICDAISAAFGSDARLPKDLAPDRSPAMWRETLEACLVEYYKRACVPCVTVIVSDDLPWPAITGMEPGLAADWHRLMHTVRECIDDAGRINNGIPPTSEIVKKAKVSKFHGKLLWLMCRNTELDVQSMYGPIVDKAIPIELRFPMDVASRRRILEENAGRWGYTFAPEALDLAARDTLAYRSGRDLVGDATTYNGLLYYAMREVDWPVYESEYESPEKDVGVIPAVNSEITEDIIRAWLAGPQHQAIMAKATRPAQVPVPSIENMQPSSTDQQPASCVPHYFRGKSYWRPTEVKSATFENMLVRLLVLADLHAEHPDLHYRTAEQMYQAVDEKLGKIGFKVYLSNNWQRFIPTVKANIGVFDSIVDDLCLNKSMRGGLADLDRFNPPG